MTSSCELRVFGDALRAVLGLEPIYITGRGRAEISETERFYVAPVRTKAPRTPVRGSGA